jgi:hypothetical protein
MLARHPAGDAIASPHGRIRRGGGDNSTCQLGRWRSGRWITDRSRRVQAPLVRSFGAALECTRETRSVQRCDHYRSLTVIKGRLDPCSGRADRRLPPGGLSPASH